MGIIKFLKPQDFFTFCNTACGFSSILLCLHNEFSIAANLLLVAVTMDYMDGKIGRILGKPHEFGKELDSLADAVTFGAASAVFGYCYISFTSGGEVPAYAILIFFLFICCGIGRLARFNITKLNGYFQGMPITMNGIIVPAIYVVDLPGFYYPFIYLFSGLLMISELKFKKIS